MIKSHRKKIIACILLLLGASFFLILFFLATNYYSFQHYKKMTSIPTTALVIEVIVQDDINLGMVSVYERSHPIYCPVIRFIDHDNEIHESLVVEYYCSTQPIYKIGDTLPIFRADRQGIAVRIPHIYSNEYQRYVKVTVLYALLDTFEINLF